VERRFFWPGWSHDVKRYCKSCDECARYHRGKLPKHGPLKPVLAGAPYERWYIDLTGPHPKSDRGNIWILTCMDAFTKWAEAFPLKSKEAEPIVRVLTEQIFTRFGPPLSLLSDMGREVDGRIMRDICRLFGVEKLRTTAYKPSTNQVERFHRTMNSILAKTVSDHQKDWDTRLPFAMAAYRATQHDTTGYSPNFLVLGRETRAPPDLVFGSPDEEATDSEQTYDRYVESVREKAVNAFYDVRVSLQKSANRNKKYYDLGLKQEKFAPGEWVLYFNPRKLRGKQMKWVRQFEGPFFIISKPTSLTAKIQKSPKAQVRVVHVDKLKHFHGTPPKQWRQPEVVRRLDRNVENSPVGANTSAREVLPRENSNSNTDSNVEDRLFQFSTEQGYRPEVASACDQSAMQRADVGIDRPTNRTVMQEQQRVRGESGGSSSLDQPMGMAGTIHVDSEYFSSSMGGREARRGFSGPMGSAESMQRSELLTDSLGGPSSFRPDSSHSPVCFAPMGTPITREQNAEDYSDRVTSSNLGTSSEKDRFATDPVTPKAPEILQSTISSDCDRVTCAEMGSKWRGNRGKNRGQAHDRQSEVDGTSACEVVGHRLATDAAVHGGSAVLPSANAGLDDRVSDVVPPQATDSTDGVARYDNEFSFFSPSPKSSDMLQSGDGVEIGVSANPENQMPSESNEIAVVSPLPDLRRRLASDGLPLGTPDDNSQIDDERRANVRMDETGYIYDVSDNDYDEFLVDENGICLASTGISVEQDVDMVRVRYSQGPL